MARARVRLIRLAVGLLGAVPGLVLAWRAWQGDLGPDPLGELMRVAGRWALAFLILSLAPTPLRTLFGVRYATAARRPLGLYGFKYAAAHFLIYAGLGCGFRWGPLLETVRRSPFILWGLAALAMMLPLALTSSDGWVRRLGRRWRWLHRLAYLAALLAAWHYASAFKELRTVPVLVGLLILALLALRIPALAASLRRASPAAREAASGSPK